MIQQILEFLEKCEHWFNAHFGWFFINGRKENERLNS